MLSSTVRERKKPKKVNVEYARRARASGASYFEVARRQNVTPSAVYYALNPRKRAERARQRTGVTVSAYVPKAVREMLVARADEEGTTMSELVNAILVGEAPPLQVAKEEEDG